MHRCPPSLCAALLALQRLHHNQEYTSFDDLRGMFIPSASKQAEMRLEEMFVLALSYIKDAALQRLSVMQDLQAKDVAWVLTVPVGCANPAKHFMRHAAITAGLIEGGHDDEYLVLCMEPIAACLALGDRLRWSVGDKYLVVDCGGGTVDISAFEVSDAATGRLTQVGNAAGGPWGGTNVDKLFETFLEDFIRSVAPDVGPKGLSAFFATSTKYRISQAWERAKVNLKNQNDDCRFDLSELFNSPLGVTIEGMDRGRDLKNRGGQELVGGHGTTNLVLKPALMLRFFKPLTDKIAKAVTQELEKPELRGLTSVVMVGGFSGSVHVQATIRECVNRRHPGGRVGVVIPRSPDLAIVQGASHFVPLQCSLPPSPPPPPPYPGQGPVVKAPRAPVFAKITCTMSYGILTGEEAGDAQPMYFDPFVLKGEGYGLNHTVEKPYFVRRSQGRFNIFIGASSNPRLIHGPNKLEVIGGLQSLEKSQEFEVELPPSAASTQGGCLPCFSCGRKKQDVDDRVTITVQFSLRGIDLLVRVISVDNLVLVQEAVRFVGGMSM